MDPGDAGSINSSLPSNLEAALTGDEPPEAQPLPDMTAPAPMGRH
jgi:hypothetical protein